ncbi:hypothetical protein DFJ73DRAFT_896910 [Zopfochytrium polystomum]|nr:hypothetical protein DFJ73DRAFT_896910 [Zopfochytrium polystomum]
MAAGGRRWAVGRVWCVPCCAPCCAPCGAPKTPSQTDRSFTDPLAIHPQPSQSVLALGSWRSSHHGDTPSRYIQIAAKGGGRVGWEGCGRSNSPNPREPLPASHRGWRKGVSRCQEWWWGAKNGLKPGLHGVAVVATGFNFSSAFNDGFQGGTLHVRQRRGVALRKLELQHVDWVERDPELRAVLQNYGVEVVLLPAASGAFD